MICPKKLRYSEVVANLLVCWLTNDNILPLWERLRSCAAQRHISVSNPLQESATQVPAVRKAPRQEGYCHSAGKHHFTSNMCNTLQRIIVSSGSNRKNIRARREKAKGVDGILFAFGSEVLYVCSVLNICRDMFPAWGLCAHRPLASRSAVAGLGA